MREEDSYAPGESVICRCLIDGHWLVIDTIVRSNKSDRERISYTLSVISMLEEHPTQKYKAGDEFTAFKKKGEQGLEFTSS